MARRTWTRCKCGVGIHTRKQPRVCYICAKKQRKAELTKTV